MMMNPDPIMVQTLHYLKIRAKILRYRYNYDGGFAEKRNCMTWETLWMLLHVADHLTNTMNYIRNEINLKKS